MIRGSGIGRVVGVALLCAQVCAIWIGRAGEAATPMVTLRATEFRYAPKEVPARTGEVTFLVRNEGAIEHNFVVQDADKKKVAEIAIIEPGTVAEIRTVVASGTYTILCTLPGHRDAGMVATLRVSP